MSAEQGDPHRLAALAALASAAVLAILSVDIIVSQFPRGLIVLACLVIAFASAWYGLTRTGGARLLGSGIATLAVAGIVAVLIADGDHLAQALVTVVGLGVMLLAMRSAFRAHVPLPPASDPRHPVLFYNPKSGGGKAEKFHLAEANGRVFVNNVSIGLYAEAVQREGYREAKLRTILDTLPAALRVRIAAAHPGASPSAAMPEGAWETALALARIAVRGAPKRSGPSSR
jgi:hypothetical protein